MKKKIISLLIVLAMLVAVVPAVFAADDSTITVYFQNNWLWTDVNVHYWGVDFGTEWSGIAMTLVENDGTYDIYSAEIPANVTGIIFNGIKDDGSDNRDQTPNIEGSNIKTGVCYYMAWDSANNCNSWGTFAYTPPVTTLPAGAELSLGDNNVSLVYATMPMMASKWTYTAPENGYVTVTVTSINGNSNLGMAFGRGMYTLMVGEATGEWTNTATVYAAAGTVLNIAVLDTADFDGATAVINVAFEAGEEQVEANPADYFDGSGTSDDPFIIGSLETPVDIFSRASDDIVFKYIAESDGTVDVAASVDGYEATNCWIKVNDGSYTSVLPATVSEGDVVLINIWNGYAGTVSLAPGEAGGSEGGNDGVVGSGMAEAEEDSKFTVLYTPETNGVLTVTVGDGNAAWISDVMNFNDFSTTSPVSGNAETTYTVDVEAGVTYCVRIYGAGDPPAAISNIPYSITFTASEGGSATTNSEYEYADGIYAPGDHTVSMLPNTDMTVVEFCPPETGVYTITATGDIAMVGTTWPNTTWAEAEKVTSIEWTCESVGQSIIIGLASDVTLTVSKTGEYNPIVYTEVEYENEAELNPFDASDWTVGDYVDVTEEHTAVLGEDGYYHLDSADGPILLVDLDAFDFKLSDKLQSDIPVMYLYTNTQMEDGTYIKWNLGNAVQAYDAVADENGYYPLTVDLILFYTDYAASQGVYSWVLQDIDYLDTTAWMYACVTATAPDENPGTGDNSMLSVAIAAAIVSAMAIVALPVAKKHF